MSFCFAGWTAKKDLEEKTEPGYYFIDLTWETFDFPEGYTGENIAVVDKCGFYKEAVVIEYDAQYQEGWILVRVDSRELPPAHLFYKGGLAKNPTRFNLNWTLRNNERDIYHAYAPGSNPSKAKDYIGNKTADVTNPSVVFTFYNQPAWRVPPTRVEVNVSLGPWIEFDLWIKLLEAPSATTPLLVKETNGTVQLGLYITPSRTIVVKTNWGDEEYEYESWYDFPLNEWHLLLGRRWEPSSGWMQYECGWSNYYFGDYYPVSGDDYSGEGPLRLKMESGLAEVAYFRVWQGKGGIDSTFDEYKGFLYRNGKVYHVDKAGASRGLIQIQLEGGGGGPMWG